MKSGMGERCVEEVFEIDENVLSELGESSEYWAKCHSFYQSVKVKELNSLSDKQLDWLQGIEDGMDQEKERNWRVPG